MGGFRQVLWVGGSQLGKTYLLVSAPDEAL
jgi:hypothetical protein